MSISSVVLDRGRSGGFAAPASRGLDPAMG
jgi:hypothetical protein